MVDDYDINEDMAAIVEPVLDIDEDIYWELDIKAYFTEA